MQTRLVEVSVGGFLLLGAVALMVLAVQVSDFSLGTVARKSYSLSARFDNIGSLQVRSKVTLAGVVVGQVSAIRLDKASLEAVVHMQIDREVDQLPSDTSASIYTEGLLGGNYIGLAPGAEEELLGDGDWVTETQGALVLEDLVGRFLQQALK